MVVHADLRVSGWQAEVIPSEIVYPSRHPVRLVSDASRR